MKFPDMKDIKKVKKMDKDDLLGVLGLQTKESFTGQMLGTLGTFGIGVLVGAGVALLLAPKPGRDLRDQLRTKLKRPEFNRTDNGADTLDGAPATS